MSRRWKAAHGFMAIVSLMALAGCSNKLSGTLSINGTEFRPTSCRSGLALGFSGIEFRDAAGTRVRLGSSPSGTVPVVVFPANSDQGNALGDCAHLDLQTQSSTVNHVRDVQGVAQIACGSAIPLNAMTGTITFSNCH